jgi:hypothetical protein
MVHSCLYYLITHEEFMELLGSVEAYLKNFQWSAIKYRTDRSLKDVSESLIQVKHMFQP